MAKRAEIKRPAFQFYPADWRKDPSLSVCSLAARGLWIEMMCIAHESAEYGVLVVNGVPITGPQLARMVGESPKVVTDLLAELDGAGVFSRREDGAIYSRRMLKDEHIRNVRSAAGKLGGNPNFAKDLPKQKDKLGVTPSSSSSTSVTGTDVPVHDDDDQTVIEQGIEVVQTRCRFSFHVAQTFVTSLAKIHGTPAVVAALREMLDTPTVIDPRSWLKSRLQDNPNGAPFGRRGTSAVDRVRQANGE